MERYKCFFLTDEKILKCSQQNVKQSMARMPTMCVLTSKELTSKQSECVR